MALPAFERHQAGVVVSLAAPPLDRRRRCDCRATRRSGCRRTSGSIVDGFVIPPARARPHGGDGRAAVDPSRPDPLRACGDDASRRGRDRRRSCSLRTSRGRGAPRRPRGRGAKQHVADRLRGGGGLMSDAHVLRLVAAPGAAAVSSATLHAGRLSAALQLTASDLDQPSDSATRTVGYDLFGPARRHRAGGRRRRPHLPVTGGAQRRDRQGRLRRARRAGSALAPHGRPAAREGAAPVDRPARRHRRRDRGGRRQTVRLQPSVLDAHPLVESARGAHVEQESGRPSDRRLISPRALTPDRDHVAVIVPAFTAAGTPAWATPAARARSSSRSTTTGVPHESRRRLRRARPAVEARGRPENLGAADVSTARCRR